MGEDKVLKKGLLHRRNSFGWFRIQEELILGRYEYEIDASIIN